MQPESDILVALLPQWLTSTLSQPPYFWNIDAVTVEMDSMEIRGWALPWRGLPFNRVLRCADGHLMSITNTPDTTMAAHFPYWPNAATAPLTARIVPTPRDVDYVAIESVDPANTSRNVQRLDQFSRWLFVPTSTRLAVPPSNLISHVGESSPDYYLVSGCTIFNGFKAAFEQHSDRPLAAAKRILDWGCGPGRIAIHLLRELSAVGADGAYVGVDIDAMSVEWATANIGPYFRHTSRYPPLPFQDNAFDFIFGFSIFTHLSEATQEAWLVELARLSAPGGTIAVTVMSELAVCFFEPYLDSDGFRERFARGIFDSHPNDQLTESGITGEYYRNVWMTHDFVRQRWAERFHIHAIYSNFHFYQDLVVMSPRK